MILTHRSDGPSWCWQRTVAAPTPVLPPLTTAQAAQLGKQARPGGRRWARVFGREKVRQWR